MAEFKPTAAQSAAINSRGSTVLVSAGAGSGKTKVLTERLMSYICDSEQGAELDSFLIITFTRAAAGELRGRIMDELASALAKDPGNRRLRRQSALCQRAQIGTIHSFCATLLRENSHLSGLSPDFKIIDDDRAAAMKAAALERVLERCYRDEKKLPGFRFLADTVGAGRDDRRLSELVLNLHNRMQCHARPELWAKEQVALLSSPAADAAQTPWGSEILSWAKSLASFWSGELDRLMHPVSLDPKLSVGYLPSLSVSAEQIRELCRCLDLGWDNAKACLPIEFPALKGVRNVPDEQLKEQVKIRRDACKKAMNAIADALYAPSSVLLEEMALTTPAMSALLQLTLDFDAAFSADKRRNALVDYSDLEHLSAQLLTEPDGSPSELARQLSRRYTEIMVDEYQDVSLVQDSIFRAISNDGRNLFLVGDVKQSIYRFRLADPGIFTDKYLSYADNEYAAPGEARRIMLKENFRSRREILNCANSVFSLCMSRRLGDLDYDEDAALVYGASYENDVPLPELMLLELPQTEEGEESPDKTALEAGFVAAKIRSLVDSGTLINDKGISRPLEYGDIAILLRSPNSAGPAYRRALAAEGIAASSVQNGSYFSSVEISTAMSMLAVIDNPHQDIPLIAVLRSPAFGFSADELSRIRSANKQADFYTALCATAESDEKCAAFLERLSLLRDMAPDMPIAEFVWQMLSSLDMLAICSAMNDGAQRRANLMELVELSEQYERSGYKGLHRFVLWLRRLAQRGQEPAGDIGSSAVQIMSIHKSKGLEFPVVFLCDTSRRFNKQDSHESVLVHPRLGLGPKVTDLQRRVEYPTLARNAIKLCMDRETLSEEMRLLYVALTRPKERLFITASYKDPGATVEKARALLTVPMAPELLASAASLSDWLISAALADGGQHLKLSFCSAVTHQQAAEAEETAVSESSGQYKALEEKLSFEYPYLPSQQLPSKVTATELKGRSQQDEDAMSLAPVRRRKLSLPDFARADKPLSGTERGIASHLVLQYINFEKTGSIEDIRAEIKRLEAERFISPREAAAVDAHCVFKLFDSELGRQLRSAGKLHREFKFSLLCSAQQVFGEGGEDQVLLQGVVDCCIEHSDCLTVVDYKTDRISGESDIERLSARYAAQLSAYASALERIFKKPVKECALYFISAGKAVFLPQK